MSDKIEAALQPGAPPIDVSVLRSTEVNNRHGLYMAGAALLLERIIEADQQYLDAVQSQEYSSSRLASLAHQAQVTRFNMSFTPADRQSFGFVVPDTEVTFVLPHERKGKWGTYERHDRQVATTDLTSVALTSSRLHGGIYVPGQETKDAFVRMDIDGLRTRHGPVQLCIGMAALETIELIPSPSKDDMVATAKQVGTALGLVVK